MLSTDPLTKGRIFRTRKNLSTLLNREIVPNEFVGEQNEEDLR